MRALSPKVLGRIRDYLDGKRVVSMAEVREWIAALDYALKPKRSAAPARSRRETRKTTRKQKTADVRAECVSRAQGQCEACGADISVLEMDHFRGGSHKRSNESVQGCWMLCRLCHRAKTDSQPSRLHWLAEFREHCLEHGYTREARDTEALIDGLYLSAASQGGG